MTSATAFTPAEAQAIARKTTRWNLVAIRVLLFGFLFLEYFWPSTHPAMIATYWVLMGYFVFSWASCFHEAIHQTLCSSLGFNRHLGRVIGVFTYMPYTAYRESHIRHHAYLNRPEDWELWPYSDPHRSLTFRRIFVWIDLIFGAFTVAVIYGRIYFHKNSPLSRESRTAIRNEYLVTIVFWIVFATYLTWNESWLGFLRIWFVPTFLAGILQSGRKLTEHLGMVSYDPLLGTRTVRGKSWVTIITSFLNFDIFVHGPHHRHPRAGHTSLGKMMDEYVSDNPQTDYPVYSSYWRATAAMLPWLFKNPGVGMNIGAEDSRQVTGADVEDFESDVTLTKELVS